MLAALAAAVLAQTPVYGFKVRNVYPHDPGAFTQGLVWHEGALYEGTGLHGRSSVRKVALETGKVLRRHPLPDNYFGEGIAILADRLYQLTWQEGLCFVYEVASFRQVARLRYEGEGWGLTHDGKRLVMSDGSSTIRYRDPKDFTEVGSIRVTDGGRSVEKLNELEWIDGEIWANVWQTDRIARVDPATGKVRSWIDLAGLLPTMLRTGQEDVLNGIAYDSAKKRIFVTGKLWGRLFEIELVPPGTVPPGRER
jgi:glutamine cyclotransferase